jgi:acyl carrier protein
MKGKILEKVVIILKKDPFNIEVEITRKTELSMLPNWDSLKYLTFWLEIEDVFQIELNPEDINSISTIDGVLIVINKYDYS